MWFSDWTGDDPLALKVPFVHISDSALRLQDLIRDGQWMLQRCSTMMTEDVLALFDKVLPQVLPNEEDIWCWDHGGSGSYTVRDGYAWLRDRNQPPMLNKEWNWLWKIPVPEKIRIFLWLVLHQALPVNAYRFKCHLTSTESCSRCSDAREDCLHCLRDCPYSRELWAKLGAWSWHNFAATDLSEWIISKARGRNSVRFIAGLWGVWKWRNNMVLDPHPWPLHVA